MFGKKYHNADCVLKKSLYLCIVKQKTCQTKILNIMEKLSKSQAVALGMVAVNYAILNMPTFFVAFTVYSIHVLLEVHSSTGMSHEDFCKLIECLYPVIPPKTFDYSVKEYHVSAGSISTCSITIPYE